MIRSEAIINELRIGNPVKIGNEVFPPRNISNFAALTKFTFPSADPGNVRAFAITYT